MSVEKKEKLIFQCIMTYYLLPFVLLNNMKLALFKIHTFEQNFIEIV